MSLCEEKATNAVKGKRLEGLLAFLLSQIRDLVIGEINLRTESEELDIVMKQRGVGRRSWQIPGAPFILVEAKNWSSKADQPVVSSFLVKIQRKRGNCRLGILVGISRFTKDAKMQELAFSGNGNITICFVEKQQLQDWIEAEDFDDFFEAMLDEAMLR